MGILANKSTLVVGLLAAAVATPGQAQLSNQAAQPNDRIAISSGGPLARPGASNKDDPGISPEFQITSIDEMVVGEFALTWSKGDVTTKALDEAGNQTRIAFRRQNLLFKASVPFNSIDTDNPFINFSNIGNDGQVSLEYISMRGQDVTGRIRYANLQLVVQQCLSDVAQEWLASRRPSASFDDMNAVAEVLQNYTLGLSSLPSPIGTGDVVNFVNLQLANAENVFWEEHRNSCRITKDGPIRNQDDLTDRYGREALERRGMISVWGVTASAGYQEFNLLDRAAFRLDTVDRVGFEIEGFLGIIASNGNISGRLTGAFVRSYEAQNEVEFCRDVSAGALECLKGPDLLPTRRDSFVLRAEGRLVLHRDLLGRPNFATAPEVSYDVSENEWLFDLPIYLQRSEENGLDAGIRLAYGTKDSDFGAGLFVGVPFAGLF